MEGWEVERKLQVVPSDVEVKLRIEVGPPGTLTGRIRWGSLPRPEMVLVINDGEGIWIDERGEPIPRWTGPAASIGANEAFRFGNLRPGRVRLWLKSDGAPMVWGETFTDIVPDRDTQVTIVAVPAGRVRFRCPAGTTGGSLAVLRELTDGSWAYIENVAFEVTSGKETVVEGGAPAGTLRWRATFAPKGYAGIDSALHQEGEVTVAARRTAEVLLRPVE